MWPRTPAERDLEVLWPGLTGEPAYPTLREHLALLALGGEDPLTVLVDAAQARELDSSGDRAAVLDWRLPSRATGPLPWLQVVPAPLAAYPQWGPYLGARAERVSALADLVRAEAAGWTPAGAPAWAADLTSEAHVARRADLAVWRAAYAVPDTEPRPTGPAQLGADAAAHQHHAPCGRTLVAAKDERQGRRYACIASPGTGRCGGISITAEPLEDFVTESVLLALDGSRLPAQPAPDATPLVQEIESLRADLDALAADHGTGRISRAEWLAAREGLNPRLVNAERMLQDAVSAAVVPRLSDSADAVKRSWPSLDVDAKRRVLGTLLGGVIVSPARVRGRHFDADRVRLVWHA